MYTLDETPRCVVISALVEGNRIRSIERMTGIHRDTIMRLLVRVGEGCARLMDEQMHDLTCKRLQLDELWAFVGMKQKRASQLADRGEFGDAYTFVALDADTKLVPCFHVGVGRGRIPTRSFAICGRASSVGYRSPRMRLRPIIRPSERLSAGG
jgi:hypothetical protein